MRCKREPLWQGIENFGKKFGNLLYFFITQHSTRNFIEMVPMKVHLNFFKSFHQSLQRGELAQVNVSDNTVLLGVKTPEGLNITQLDLTKENDAKDLPESLVFGDLPRRSCQVCRQIDQQARQDFD